MNTLPHLTQLLDRHLTDEQLYNLLESADSADATLRLHLAACAECRAELTTVRASLTNFRLAATSLASSEMMQHRAVAPRRTPRFQRLVWSASLAMAAVVFTASVSLVHPAAPDQAQVVAPVENAAAPVSDDALLDNIQQDLSTSIPPSLEPLAVPAASSSTNTSN
jgi:hypothetical protein